MHHQITNTKQFRKDYQRLKSQGKNLDKLETVLDFIKADMPLPNKYKDHKLSGQYKGYRDCHIEPDWILLYRKDADTQMIILTRMGSHSDLFK